MSETSSDILLLSEEDNVLIARSDLPAGSLVFFDGEEVRLGDDIPLGHKLARRDIPQGGKIMKYGAPIGSASRPITKGGHVHVQNLESDYVPFSDTLGHSAEVRKGG